MEKQNKNCWGTTPKRTKKSFIAATIILEILKYGGVYFMDRNHIFPFLWMRGESEEIIREEMEKISECGIGAVCVEARPHDEFCKDGWWHDMDIIIEEAKKRQMKVWILDDKHFPTGYANGLIVEKYPERKKMYIANSKANVYGYPNRQLTLDIRRMLKPAIGFWEIPNSFKNMEERAKNKMLTIVAVKLKEGRTLSEEVIDLTDTVKDNFATFTLPEGVWTVYVIFKTRCDGGKEDYINFLDAESAYTQIEAVYEPHFAHYADEFGKTIAGFFSDEPQFANIEEISYTAKLGTKKMPLPWSDEVEAMLKERYGDEYTRYLPFLFQESDTKVMQDRIRYDYMDIVSRLYKKNFSDTVGAWCAEHGVEYIGHVVEENSVHSRFGLGAAHYFRAISGQHMSGIDCIGEQVMLGAPVQARQGLGELGGDGEFHHYTLGKLGASAGHLDPKKKGRTMCELFGAYGWNFGVRDMKYVLDHLLVKGINELVPHAFSMAEYPDEDCPPHFYARGNNPQFPYFAKLMKYANRMCELLSGGQHVASAAVLYDGEADWVADAMPMQKVNRVLLENQIDLDIVWMDLLENLEDYKGAIQGNKLTVNGVTFDALVVPYTRAIPEHFARWIVEAKDLPIIFADNYPETVIDAEEGLLEQVRSCSKAIPLAELAENFKKNGFVDVQSDTECKELSFYHYRKDQKDIFVFQNESPAHGYQGTVTLPSGKEFVYYDALKDVYEECTTQHIKDGVNLVALDLAPVECVVLVEKDAQKVAGVHQSYAKELEGLTSMDISNNWKLSKVRAIAYPAFDEEVTKDTLASFSDEYPTFSGVILYRKTVQMENVPERAFIKAEQVYELMKVRVNGKEAGYRILPPYQVDISQCLVEGDNEIEIEVTTTPSRETMDLPKPPFDFSYEAYEATGMFGKIEIYK